MLNKSFLHCSRMLPLLCFMAGCTVFAHGGHNYSHQITEKELSDKTSCECTAPAADSGLDEVHSNEMDFSCSLQAPKAADWNLGAMDPEVVAFFSGLSRDGSISLSTLLGEAADSYFNRQYSFEDFQKALLSLKGLISSKHSAAAGIDGVGLKLEDVLTDPPLIVYIDPLCDHCKKVLDLVLKISEICPSEAPRVIVRLLPSSNKASRDAAAVLDLVKLKQPDNYLHACVEFLLVLSSDSDKLDELAKEYLGEEPYRKSNEFRRSRERVMSVYNSFPGNEEGAPLVIFRGRILRKDPSRNFPFDPLKDWKMLLLTIRLVKMFDAAEAGRT